MDNRIMDLTTADNIIQEIASKGVTQINRLILFGGEPFLNPRRKMVYRSDRGQRGV